MLTNYELGYYSALMKLGAELPYRERVEVLARDPNTGNIFSGIDAKADFATFFGGGIDPGESPEVAGAREFLEETGRTLENPRALEVDPVTLDWSTLPYLSKKLKERSKTYKGSRTHFITGDVDPSADPVALTEEEPFLQQPDFRSPEELKKRWSEPAPTESLQIWHDKYPGIIDKVGAVTTELMPHQQRVVERLQKPGIIGKMLGKKPRGVEQVLSDMAADKRELNEQLLGLMQ